MKSGGQGWKKDFCIIAALGLLTPEGPKGPAGSACPSTSASSLWCPPLLTMLCHTEIPAVPRRAQLSPASGPWLMLFPLPRAPLACLAPSHPTGFSWKIDLFIFF